MSETKDGLIDNLVDINEYANKEVELFRKLIFHTKAFLTDLECILEMFNTVYPILKQQDNARNKYLDETSLKLDNITDNISNISEDKIINLTKEINNLTTALRKLDRANAMFRQNAIVILVSRYDRFLGAVFSLMLRAHPERLRSPDKTLCYEEILQLTSIEAAIGKFISKEVDQLLRLPHSEKIEYLDKQLKCGLKDGISCWPDFIELTECRHLFAHTGGLVTQQYLQICARNGVKLSEKVREGISIDITQSYFLKAYRCLYEIGVRIGQSVLRKVFPDNLSEADDSLVEIGYNLLTQEDWELAGIILDFALSIPRKLISSDADYRIYVVNRCIAYKWSGHQDKMLALLASVDWSAVGTRYLLPVTVLKDQYKDAEEIMSTMNGNDPIDENAFRTWPVFRDFRDTDYFKRAFKKLYRLDFVPSVETSPEEVRPELSLET
ncbi:MAG: hypothetical protein ACYCZF_12635 [Anaerolineae bacterium]